jgi:hypothetical protein
VDARVYARWSSLPLSQWAGTGRLVPETGPKSHRHHQHHGLYVPDPMERHETPDPLRSNALESRFQCVRQQADLHDQHKLTRNTVLVMLMGLACNPRPRGGPRASG